MKLKASLKNLSLLMVSVIIVLLIAEIISRYVVPVSPGPRLLSMDGAPIRQSYVTPGAEYRIVTPDFDAHTTITEDGYRSPASSGSPQTIFLGDSFTFAQGVTDDQAFPYLYCKAKKEDCVNLSVPGASTLFETFRLEQYLKEKGWAPDNVYLFFFSGNDFSDNTWAAKQKSNGLSFEPYELNPELEAASLDSLPVHKKAISNALKYSNLLRVAYHKVFAELKQKGNPENQQRLRKHALSITQKSFRELERLSNEYSFNYRIFVLHPEPVIRLGQYKKVDQELQGISPVELVTLGGLFSDNSQKYFFPADGHFTESGNRLLADYLLKVIP